MTRLVTVPRTEDRSEIKRWYLNISREVNTIASDLTVVTSDVVSIGSDLTVVTSDVVSIGSDLTVVTSDVVSIGSDLIVAESDIDTLESDIDLLQSIAAKSGTATLTTSERIILCNGTFTVTLPAVSGNTGKDYIIKNIGTGTITIDGNGSETIDNGLTLTLGSMESVQVVCDGTEWWIA